METCCMTSGLMMYSAGHFHNGFARVELNGEFKLIDSNGDIS